MAKLLLLTLLVACNAELILDGGDNGWSQWYRSVDGVMGGRSSISVQRDGNVLVFLMAIGIGCSLWARGARVDPSDSKAAAAAAGEETEEPLQVV